MSQVIDSYLIQHWMFVIRKIFLQWKALLFITQTKIQVFIVFLFGKINPLLVKIVLSFSFWNIIVCFYTVCTVCISLLTSNVSFTRNYCVLALYAQVEQPGQYFLLYCPAVSSEFHVPFYLITGLESSYAVCSINYLYSLFQWCTNISRPVLYKLWYNHSKLCEKETKYNYWIIFCLISLVMMHAVS